jgi:hypothetical protein
MSYHHVIQCNFSILLDGPGPASVVVNIKDATFVDSSANSNDVVAFNPDDVTNVLPASANEGLTFTFNGGGKFTINFPAGFSGSGIANIAAILVF